MFTMFNMKYDCITCIYPILAKNMKVMKRKGKKIIVIPEKMEVAPGEYGEFEAYPDAVCYGDQALAEILGVSRLTIARWRRLELIPFTQKRNYCEYNVLSVVRSLLKAGYSQNGNPTAHNR